jgi:hypothetical protein
MRDAYPLVISRVENINKLFENDAIMEGLVWLPVCLVFNAIRLDTIGRATRLFMLRVSWFMFWDLYDRKKRKVDKNPPTGRIKGHKLTVFTSQWSIHFFDTGLLLILSIETYECIALDRERTHPLQNFFGHMRKDSNDVNTPARMKAVIAHTEIVTQALIDLELDQTIPGRANLAGVQLTDGPLTKKVSEIELAPPIDPEAVAQICLKAAHVIPNLSICIAYSELA